QPTCVLCYTVKAYQLPLAGHKDNHAGLMNPDQMAEFQRRLEVPEGQEWEPFAGLKLEPRKLRSFLEAVPFNARGPRRYKADYVPLPESLPQPEGHRMSTQ